MDFAKYTERLEASMKEKLFFVNEINLDEYDFILDFGCGTGLLLNEVVSKIENTENKMFCGFDKSEKMIEIARDRYSKTKLLCFTNNFDYIVDTIAKSNKKLIIFSSVLHELTEKKQREAIEIMQLFDTIVLRDMKRPLNNEKVSIWLRKSIFKQVPSWQKNMYERKWGKIKNTVSLYRFLLMNEFVENYENELKEDYFSVPWSIINWELRDYKTKYSKNYTLKYRKEQVLKRFCYDMRDITYCELIFERIKEESNNGENNKEIN